MVIRSMTAYSQTSFETKKGLFTLELHTINRKGLEISLYLPKELMYLDVEIRGWISAIFRRGQITFKMFRKSKPGLVQNIENQSTLYKNLRDHWRKIANELGMDQSAITLEFLAEQAEKIEAQVEPANDEEFEKDLKKAFHTLSSALLHMKIEEGEVLGKDFEKRLQIISNHLDKVEVLAESQPEKVRKKLLDRIAELKLGGPEIDERLHREVVFLADKADITEEITRLRSHLEQFRAQLLTKEPSIGKTLDFLIVEMHREVNTMGAKSQELEITQLILQMKTEVERMREQVQNIE